MEFSSQTDKVEHGEHPQNTCKQIRTTHVNKLDESGQLNHVLQLSQRDIKEVVS
jgi:hypothetical protein